MAFRVEISAEAESDASAIPDRLLKQHAGETGIRWFLELEDAIASLASFPEGCTLAPESSCFPFQVRQLLYGRRPHVYRILYTIEDLHIRHGHRKRLGS